MNCMILYPSPSHGPFPSPAIRSHISYVNSLCSDYFASVVHIYYLSDAAPLHVM